MHWVQTRLHHMTVTCLECVLEASLKGVWLGKVYCEAGVELGVDVHHLRSDVTQWKVADHVIRLKWVKQVIITRRHFFFFLPF